MSALMVWLRVSQRGNNLLEPSWLVVRYCLASE
jgi:hypothetical protein